MVFIESVTTVNADHHEIQENDTATAKQNKSLNAEVRAIHAKVTEMSKFLDLLSGSAHVGPAVFASGPSWKDKVAPPSEGNKRMDLQFFSPMVKGGGVRISPPKSLEILRDKRWKDCIVGHFVDKKLHFLTVRSIASKIWSKYDLNDVLSNDKGFFFFQFELRVFVTNSKIWSLALWR